MYIDTTPIVVQRCTISNCSCGIDVGGKLFDGRVELNDNTIIRCRFTVKRIHGAGEPIINGIASPCASNPVPESFTANLDLSKGKDIYEKREKFHKAVRTAVNIEVIDSVLKAGIEGLRPCQYCTVMECGEKLSKYIFCEKCQYAYYCSPQCFEKGKEFHKMICANNLRRLKVYEDSLTTEKKNSGECPYE